MIKNHSERSKIVEQLRDKKLILEMKFKRTRQTLDDLGDKIHMVVEFGYAMSVTEMSEFTPGSFGH